MRTGGLIWDPILRVLHWVLVGLVAGAFWLGHFGPILKTWHFWCGYGIAAVLILRIVWGFVGPDTARFRQFIRGPRSVMQYASSLAVRTPSPQHGHSPLGGWATLALLAALAMQVATGLFADDEIFSAGPMAEYVTEATRQRASQYHAWGGWALLALIGLHLSAIIFYSVWKRQDLVTPMITGRSGRTRRTEL